MSRLKELVFGVDNFVSLRHIDDGDAVYELRTGADGHILLMTFTVPRDDLRGAQFAIRDTPKLFMRWIRKELERRDAESELIKRAREDWETEEYK